MYFTDDIRLYLVCSTVLRQNKCLWNQQLLQFLQSFFFFLSSLGSANYHMIKYTTVIDSGAKSGWTKQNPVCWYVSGSESSSRVLQPEHIYTHIYIFIYIYIYIPHTWHLIPDTWHMTPETWMLSPDTWNLQLDIPSSLHWVEDTFLSFFHFPFEHHTTKILFLGSPSLPKRAEKLFWNN